MNEFVPKINEKTGQRLIVWRSKDGNDFFNFDLFIRDLSSYIEAVRCYVRPFYARFCLWLANPDLRVEEFRRGHQECINGIWYRESVISIAKLADANGLHGFDNSFNRLPYNHMFFKNFGAFVHFYFISGELVYHVGFQSISGQGHDLLPKNFSFDDRHALHCSDFERSYKLFQSLIDDNRQPAEADML